MLPGSGFPEPLAPRSCDCLDVLPGSHAGVGVRKCPLDDPGQLRTALLRQKACNSRYLSVSEGAPLTSLPEAFAHPVGAENPDRAVDQPLGHAAGEFLGVMGRL